MSRTDKTNPHWVKLARREWGARPRHWHHGRWFTGICEAVAPMPPTRRNGQDRSGCEIWVSYYSDYAGDKVWGRRPSGKNRRAYGKDGKARATLRRLKHKWMRAAEVEDIDSYEDAPYRRWLWAKWYWD